MEFAVAHCLKITKNVSHLIFNTFVMIQAFSILNETFSLIFKHRVCTEYDFVYVLTSVLVILLTDFLTFFRY